MTKRGTSPDAYHPWTTYIDAREEARRRGDRRVGTEHLLLGLLHLPSLASALHVELGAARRELDELDAAALGAIGVPTGITAPPLPMLPAPPRPTVRAVLHQRLTLTPAAAQVLRDAGRPMRRGGEVSPQAVLLRLLNEKRPDPGAALIDALAIDRGAVRDRIFAGAASDRGVSPAENG